MIRTATKTDIPFLADGLTGLVEHTKTSGDVYFADFDDDYNKGFGRYLTRFLEDEKAILLIAEVKKQSVGFILGQITSPFIPFSKIKKVGEIAICWVNPNYQGQGIAAKLVIEAEAWFAEQGVEYVQLQYIVGNTKAEKFWSRQQYKPFRIEARKKIVQ